MSAYYDKDSGLNFYYYGDPEAPAGDGGGAQIFPDIVDDFYKTNNQFVDPYFPPNEASLGEMDEGFSRYTVKWLRPKEIMKEMFPESKSELIFHGPYDQFGVNQGAVGDCWFLAVLADAALKPACINTLVPEDNVSVGFGPGAFHFRFWCRGKWIDVVVDDLLPCLYVSDGFCGTAFCKPTEHAGFWACYVEKAYAKIYGTYGAMAYGWSHEAMEDFTGGITQMLGVQDMAWNEFLDKIKTAIAQDSLVAVGTIEIPEERRRDYDPKNPGAENISSDGIVGKHAYSVLDVQEVQDKKDPSRKFTIVKCRNPWGNKEEWVGDFSDSDPNGTWQTVTQDLRTGNATDGQFWIPIMDLYNYANLLYDCRWSGSCRGDSTVRLGNATFYNGHGNFTKANSGSTKGTNSGYFLGKAGYYAHLSTEETDKGEAKADGLIYNCGFAVTLMYKNYKRAGLNEQIPGFGFHLLWAPGNDPPTDSKFFYNVNFGVFNENTFVCKQREFNMQVNLPAGTVLIVPWLSEWDGEGAPYLIRIISEGGDLKEIPAA